MFTKEQFDLTIPVPKMAHRIRSSSAATGTTGIYFGLLLLSKKSNG
jgi:hypothetical protein